MAEFLVNIVVEWPQDGDPDLRDALVEAEAERARELTANGTIKRLWRVPGRWENWGLWEADDATSLHAELVSLPFFPWISASVIPLAEHPSDPCKDL